MRIARKATAILLMASSVALAGCYSDGYGYGGVNVGYGGYGDYYDDYGYGYGSPYGGWSTTYWGW